jgi:HlyD family secretion protein
MKRSLVPAALALALALTPSAPAQPGKATYRTATIRRATFQPFVVATGTLQPEEVVEVGAPVAGTVVKFGADPRDKDRTVDSGTPVDEGTVLVQLDPAPYKSVVEQAKAKVARAESESRLGDIQMRSAELVVNRFERLGMAVGQTEMARARYDLEMARAQGEIQRAAIREAETVLQEAERQLAQAAVRSPCKGVVLDRRVILGQAVAPGHESALFVIARDLTRMQVRALVHEADIALVKPAQAVTFKVEAFPHDSFKGKVSQVRLGPAPVKGAVAFPVVVQVENADGKLLPYLSADVRIPVGERKNVLLVPNAALTWLPEAQQVAPSARGQFYELEALRKESRVRRVVWVEDKGYVRPVVVQVGLSDGESTEVVGGDLAEGVAVVVGN